MSVLITSDIHLSHNPRDAYRYDFFATLENLIKKYKVHHLLVLGDITEKKEGFEAAFVNAVAKHFYGLSRLCLVTILKGNHDHNVDPDNPFFEFLKYIRGIDWITVPTVKPIDGSCLFLPHTSNYEKDWKNVKFDGHSWIFCHQTFAGAVFEGGRTQDGGIPLEIFPKGARVIAGDVHSRQVLGPVTYVGAPYRIDFGDDYDPRILIIDNGKKISVAIKGRQKRLPRLSRIQDLERDHPNLHSGDILKVEIDIVPSQSDKKYEYEQKINAWGKKHGLHIHSVLPRIEVTHNPSVKFSKKQAKTDPQLLRDYGNRRGVEEKILDVGLNIVEN